MVVLTSKRAFVCEELGRDKMSIVTTTPVFKPSTMEKRCNGKNKPTEKLLLENAYQC